MAGINPQGDARLRLAFVMDMFAGCACHGCAPGFFVGTTPGVTIALLDAVEWPLDLLQWNSTRVARHRMIQRIVPGYRAWLAESGQTLL